MSDDDGPSVFAEYIAEPEKERPEPELVWMSKDAAKPTRKLSPTQLLLNWIQHCWPESTICARDIYRYGPNPIRTQNSGAIALTKVLVERGWLAPIKTHRRDRLAWQIMRGPSR
jgi:hypothetical protein